MKFNTWNRVLVIIVGTAAANGVSVHDMNKRLELEQWKSQVLKNLNMFVARNRLIIHNLPANMDNKTLKDLFTKYTHPKAVLKVSKVSVYICLYTTPLILLKIISLLRTNSKLCCEFYIFKLWLINFNLELQSRSLI